jgi:hypothetical protein
MTIDEIVGLTAEQIAAMSDEELLKHFNPFLDITRPERVRQVKQKEMKIEQIVLSPQKQAALAMLKESGVDLSFLNRRKKR